MGNRTSITNSSEGFFHLPEVQCLQKPNASNIATFVDVCVTTDDWLTFPKVLRDALSIALSSVGFLMSSIIVNYLESKALGLQSLIDVPSGIMFKTVRILNIVCAAISVIGNHLLDPGHWIASVLIWSAFDLMLLFGLMLLVIAVVQIVKLFSPSFEPSFGDKDGERWMKLLLLLSLIGLTVACEANVIRPTPYYWFRGMPLPEDFVDIGMFRSVVFIAIMVLCYLIRIIICFKTGSFQAGDILGWKILLCLNLLTIVIGSVVRLFGDSVQDYFELFPATYTMVIPLLVVMRNRKIRKFARRHSPLYNFFADTVYELFHHTFHIPLGLCQNRLRRRVAQVEIELEIL